MKNFSLFSFILILFFAQNLFAQPNWTNADYKKALWMTTRFYGAQRSGDNNWLLYNHTGGVGAPYTGRAFYQDNDAGYDLSGGWHDCGDHVKFGQTQFYAAYILLKGYAEFPNGYDDKYTPDYAGYKAVNTAAAWTYEGTAHDPNCIPDVLDEMKHETDFLLKCIPNSTTFYYQVGDGNADHMQWVTAVKMQTLSVGNGGQTRPVYKNPADGSLPALCAATLALMSRVYQPYNAAYAATCLTAAQNAYTYAKARTGTVPDANGGFYAANQSRVANWATMCAELYWKTGTAAYQTEAISYEPSIAATLGWSFDYQSNNEIALYNLAKLGNASATTKFNNAVTGNYIGATRTGAGVYNQYGGGWGALRYNAISAFLISLYSKLNSNTTAGVINAIHNDIDYIMGKNTPKRSYIVGFEPAAGGPFVRPLKPHHRNVYLRDDNPGNADNSLTIPARNTQLGALVGGKRDGSYTDDRNDYVNSEVCIDYNAALVGALGFINERLAPVTISCGGTGCRKPNLGADLSTCSGTTLPVTLNANAGAPGGSISYKWYTWNGTTATLIGGATSNTYSAPSVGGYIVQRDSTGGSGTCSKYDTINISSTLTKPIIGPNSTLINLCSPAFVDLTVMNTGSMPGGTTYQWQSATALGGPYSNITNATSSSYPDVRTAAYYRIAVTNGSCNNSDTVRVTSSLPTPVDGCRASTGTVNLAIANPGLNGTNYNWYTNAAATILAPGSATGVTSYTTPSISATTTYYVKDMNSSSGTVGRAANTTALNNGGAANLGINFSAYATFNLISVDVPLIYYSAGVQTIQIEAQTPAGAMVKSSGMVNIPDVSGGSGYPKVVMATVPLNFTNITGSGTPDNYKIVQTGGTAQLHRETGGAYAFTYLNNPGAGNVVRLTSSIAYGANNNSSYEFFYNWQITTGTPCDPLPVIATIGSCGLPVSLASFYGYNNEDHVYLSWTTATEVNNDHFEIEKSVDGVNYASIAKIKGSGNSSSIINYSYNDYDLVYGTVYYRIVQYDYDGSLAYSKVIALERVKPAYMHVVPNPFSESANIIVYTLTKTKMELKISDMSGKVLISSDSYSTNESISVGQDLPRGVYVIQAVFDNQVYTAKMVKQ
ncbi:MAG: glycoside hydrolase family 9 protein [Cytophagaceae bacterium]|nr:glycoside hydrolase family 9 protein [Cytophagaceae bacterium]